MGLFILVASILILGNATNPDIKTTAFELETSRYELRDVVRLKENNQTVASFSPDGVEGVGLTAKTIHRDLKNVYSTLNWRMYQNPGYRLTFYSTGLDFRTLRPRIPIELTVGGEFGIGELDIERFGKYGKIREVYGWELHTGISGYFIGFDNLWNYFVRPTLRSYQFRFEGKQGIKDENINGQGFVLAAGLGVRF